MTDSWPVVPNQEGEEMMKYRATIWPAGPGTKPTIRLFETFSEARTWVLESTTSERQRLVESIPESLGMQYFEDQVTAGELDEEPE